jgi:hypothetical protein
MARGFTNPLGKLTEDVRIKFDSDTKDEASRLASEVGMGLAEWIRELVSIRVHGQDRVARLHRTRLALVAGTGTEEGE